MLRVVTLTGASNTFNIVAALCQTDTPPAAEAAIAFHTECGGSSGLAFRGEGWWIGRFPRDSTPMHTHGLKNKEEPEGGAEIDTTPLVQL